MALSLTAWLLVMISMVLGAIPETIAVANAIMPMVMPMFFWAIVTAILSLKETD